MSDTLSLTVDEAAARAALLTVHRYDLELDLTGLLTGSELRTTSTVSFSCTGEGAETFVDCLGEVAAATLNGVPLPVGEPAQGRLPLTGLHRDNVLVVSSLQRETAIGRGVHRAVDPLDQSVYVWSSFEPDDARVAFACFDQPDLKAVFGISVTAPAEWTVTSNSAPTEVVDAGADRRWAFADTPRLSTYVPVVNAGPFAELRSTRGGYDLGLFARRSLAGALERDAEQLFDLTARGLEFYGRQFGMAFPQTRYDQVFVPEMGGAMENYGCVTYSDALLFREPPSYGERELQALVLLHEMAHMWFGDMVTMRWWDDLWLNESFAEWACHWAATNATEFTDVWAGALAGDKLRAYAADQAPTTHPIRQPIPDAATAAASFDAITYPKGAAVLKQLVAYVGEESFVAALTSYFRRYAWGNTTLADLVAEIEQASGLDLSGWVAGWLGTAGTDQLTLTVEEDALTLHAVSPGERAPLPHRLDLGVYQAEAGRLVRSSSIRVQVDGETTRLAGVGPASLLLVNDDDHTFASVRPDQASLLAMLDQGGTLPTALSRTLVLATAWDLVFNGQLAPADFLRAVAGVLPAETADSVVEPLLSLAGDVADYWSPADQRDHLLEQVADLSEQLAENPARRLPAVRVLARTATRPDQLDQLTAWADSPDLRWRRLTRLAELDALDEAEVDRLLEHDTNPEAWVSAETARAAQPSAAAKERAWDLAVTQRKVPVQTMGRLGTAFWRRGQDDVLAGYREAYRDGLPGMGGSGMVWALALTQSMFPKADADSSFLERLAAAAAQPEVSPLVNQRVRERLDTLRRMLVSRAG